MNIKTSIMISTLLVLMLLVSPFALAEDPPNTDLTVQKIYEIPGLEKDKIFDRSKIWMAKNLKSKEKRAVIEYESKEGGVIVGKGYMDYPTPTFTLKLAMSGYGILFDMKEDIKDNKIRVTFENLKLIKYSSKAETPFTSERDMNLIRPFFLEMSDKLAEYVQSAKDDDKW